MFVLEVGYKHQLVVIVLSAKRIFCSVSSALNWSCVWY